MNVLCAILCVGACTLFITRRTGVVDILLKMANWPKYVKDE
jgi:hypothetical protein